MVEKMSSDLGQNSRASNALMKRNESIQKWKASDTAREKPVRYPEQFKIQFNKGICLLSAVASGDLDEAADLLDEGVDINYTNVDGLTALHQACIDENEEMVNLLIDRGADIEARDNEGWTPLHAAASAGNVEIAQILCEAGADLSAVNNEGEVPIDLAEEEEMEDYLTDEIEKRDLEMEEARNEEERVMLEDVANWMNVEKMDEVLDWQGATALHVAAAKGYNKVISLLLQIRNIDVNKQDNDGWTPVHAAVHWGSKTACEMLTDAGGDFEIRNSNGQAPHELAEKDFMKTVDQCRKKSKDILKNNKNAGDPGNLMQAAQRAINLLNKKPPFPIVKGSRVERKKKPDKTDIINDSSVTNDLDSGTESGESESSDIEDKQPPPKEVAPAPTTKPMSISMSGEPTTIKITPTPLRTQTPAAKKEEPKPEPYSTAQSTASSRFTSRYNTRKEEEETKKEEDSRSRFTPTPRSFSVGSRVTAPEPKVEEKKDENPVSKYTSLRQPVKDEKVDDSRTNIRPTSKREDDEMDSRTRKKEDTGTTSIAERLKKKNEELMSSSDRGSSEKPYDRLNRSTSATTDRYTTNRDILNRDNRDTSRDNREPSRDNREPSRDNREPSRDIRDPSRDNRDPSRDNRESTRDNRESTRDNRDSNRDVRETLSSTTSTGPGRTWGVGSTASTDTGTGDTRELQKTLDKTLKEVQDYKQKYERALKEKEDLEKQMEQFKEDIEKMQELKNDNLRLKDENGALIRVISKLSRTPAS